MAEFSDLSSIESQRLQSAFAAFELELRGMKPTGWVPSVGQVPRTREEQEVLAGQLIALIESRFRVVAEIYFRRSSSIDQLVLHGDEKCL